MIYFLASNRIQYISTRSEQSLNILATLKFGKCFETFLTSWLVERSQPLTCLHIIPCLSIFHLPLQICNISLLKARGKNTEDQAPHSLVSINYINQHHHQSASISRNQHQSTSISINHYQSTSIDMHWCQSKGKSMYIGNFKNMGARYMSELITPVPTVYPIPSHPNYKGAVCPLTTIIIWQHHDIHLYRLTSVVCCHLIIVLDRQGLSQFTLALRDNYCTFPVNVISRASLGSNSSFSWCPSVTVMSPVNWSP